MEHNDEGPWNHKDQWLQWCRARGWKPVVLTGHWCKFWNSTTGETEILKIQSQEGRSVPGLGRVEAYLWLLYLVSFYTNSWQSGQNIGRANLSVHQLTSWPPLETTWQTQKLCFPVSRYLSSAVNLTSGINQATGWDRGVPPWHTFSSKLTVLGIYTGIFSNTRLGLKMFLLSVWERKQKNFISGGEPKNLPLLWSCPWKRQLVNPWTGQGRNKGLPG